MKANREVLKPEEPQSFPVKRLMIKEGPESPLKEGTVDVSQPSEVWATANAFTAAFLALKHDLCPLQ